MSDAHWDDHYAAGTPPWDTGVPCPHLEAALPTLPRGRALEIGCGTGTNAVFLARNGYRVVAFDLSPLAIERARARAADAGVEVDLRVADVLTDDVPGGPFDLVYDRGVFHTFQEPEDQVRFAERVAGVLAPGGRWLSMIGSTEGGPRELGPPRRTLREVVAAIEPSLRIFEVEAVTFASGTGPNAADAWRVIAGPRTAPAAPSTRWDGRAP